MIPPLTEEEFERLIPDCVKELARQGLNRTFVPVVGMYVYDILHGPRLTRDGIGIVKFVTQGSGTMGYGISVWAPPDSWSGTVSYYYVPCPEELLPPPWEKKPESRRPSPSHRMDHVIK